MDIWVEWVWAEFQCFLINVKKEEWALSVSVYTFAHDTGKEQTESGKHVVSGHSGFLEVNPQTWK